MAGALSIVVAACAIAGIERRAAERLPELARQVEIRRTTYGVPQILAHNLRAAAFALAYVQLEDHGGSVINGMQAARGRSALIEGERRVDADARARQRHARAVETFRLLRPDTRDVYTGFAAGMNHFIRIYRDQLPAWVRPDFTPQDVFARDIGWPSDAAMNTFRQRLLASPENPPVLVAGETGSWRRVARPAVTRSCYGIRTSPGPRDTTRRTSVFPASSTSTAIFGLADRSR
jgi:acyl-homoserine lactone acylase PvdQ